MTWLKDRSIRSEETVKYRSHCRWKVNIVRLVKVAGLWTSMSNKERSITVQSIVQDTVQQNADIGEVVYFLDRWDASLVIDKVYPLWTVGHCSSIGSVSAWHASGPEFNPHVRHILSWRLGHETNSMAIHPLPLIQEEHLSVTGERRH